MVLLLVWIEGWTVQCIEPTKNRFGPRGEEKSGVKYLRPRIEKFSVAHIQTLIFLERCLRLSSLKQLQLPNKKYLEAGISSFVNLFWRLSLWISRNSLIKEEQQWNMKISIFCCSSIVWRFWLNHFVKLYGGCKCRQAHSDFLVTQFSVSLVH